MGNTKEKEWLSVVLLAIAVLGALFFSIDRLFFHGILGACIRLSETHEMALELMILGMIIFFLLTFTPGKWKNGGLLLFFSGFLWIHRILIPILVSGCYLAVICLIGMNIGRDHVVLCHVCSGNRKYPVAVRSSAGGRRRGGDPVLARKMGVECQSVAKATRRRRRILRAGFFFKRYQPKSDRSEPWSYVCSLDSCPSGRPDERGH